MVRVSFRPGEKEIHTIAGLSMKFDGRLKRSRFMFLAIGIGCVMMAAVCGVMKMKIGGVFFAALGAFALVMALTGIQSRVERAMGKFDTTAVAREYLIDGTGISADSELGRIHYGWDKFIGWGHRKSYIYVLATSYQAILLDKGQLNEAEIKELEDCLRQNVRYIS